LVEHDVVGYIEMMSYVVKFYTYFLMWIMFLGDGIGYSQALKAEFYSKSKRKAAGSEFLCEFTTSAVSYIASNGGVIDELEGISKEVDSTVPTFG
jgi:hypothetical protein